MAVCRASLLVVVVGVVTMTPPVTAQPTPGLFVALAPELSASAVQPALDSSPAIVARAVVGMLLDQVFPGGNPAPMIRLNLGTHDWTARLQRADTDAITGFRSWVGTIDRIDHSHVVLTLRDGVVSGLINAVNAVYQIRTSAPGLYFLEHVDTRQLGVEQEPLPGVATTGPAADLATPDDGRVVDVLMLYTPAAESAAGGGAQVLSIASQIISDTNTIFLNSGIVPRVRLVGASLLAMTEGATLHQDLMTVTNSATARALRDGFGADLVQLLVNSGDPIDTGLAWILTTPGATDFTAYSVVKIGAVAAYTPTHEMAHNMGSHHAPEDGASAGLFPYSLGYKDPLAGLRTVMAYDCPPPGCPRIPHMSSQTITFQGKATGTIAQNNALSINSAAFTVANWRQSVTGSHTAPAVPTNLQTHVSGTRVAFEWSSSPGTTSYTLQIGTAPGLSDVGSGALGQRLSIELTLGLGSYYWRVIASNAYGASTSLEAHVSVTSTCGVSTAPVNLIASVNGGHVMLGWSPPALGAVSSYIVEAGSTSGATNLYNAPVGAQPIVQAHVPAGVYFVRVRAANGCGHSEPSNEVAFIVDPIGANGGALTPPQNLQIALTNTAVTANWNLAAGALPPSAFIIEAGSAPGLSDLAVIEVPGHTLSYTTMRPAPGNYHVRVRAREGAALGPATVDVLLSVP